MQKESSKTNQYHPAEDTFFFADNLENEHGELALDIGTGSGYLSQILQHKFSYVISTDIDFKSLEISKQKVSNCICCDGAEPLLCKFDLIVCNMPYLPSKKIVDKTIDGGKEGIEIPFKIINSAKHCLKEAGTLLFLTSSLANYQKLLDEVSNLGFFIKIMARKKLFFEELILVKCKKIQNNL